MTNIETENFFIPTISDVKNFGAITAEIDKANHQIFLKNENKLLCTVIDKDETAIELKVKKHAQPSGDLKVDNMEDALRFSLNEFKANDKKVTVVGWQDSPEVDQYIRQAGQRLQRTA